MSKYPSVALALVTAKSVHAATSIPAAREFLCFIKYHRLSLRTLLVTSDLIGFREPDGVEGAASLPGSSALATPSAQLMRYAGLLDRAAANAASANSRGTSPMRHCCSSTPGP